MEVFDCCSVSNGDSFLIVLIMQLEKTALVSGNVSAMRTVVIDPGHGGADGGAVGYSGSIEKDLNLDISLKLRDYCRLVAIG